MMKLQTLVSIPSYPDKISYDDRITMIGSCFSENVGRQLLNQKYRGMINPFGVMYNPLSVKQNLEIIIHKNFFDKENLHFANRLWFSYDHHTSFSNTSDHVILQVINDKIVQANDHLSQSKFLFLTFGTARVYTLKETGKVVANCHKQAQALFNHNLLTVDTIIEAYDPLITNLQEQFPDLQLVFTVSPVRHWKDGAMGNQVSKSTLILAIQRLLDNHENCYYFPAYEIFMDELRDYRFYADDMLHPSTTGKNYIWQRFAESFLNPDEQTLRDKIDSINRAYQHRPYFPDSNEYTSFVRKTLNTIDSLQQSYPYLDFEAEKQFFQTVL